MEEAPVNALFDTNVLLDLFLKRAPFARDAAWLVNQVEREKLRGVLGATTVTTIYYYIAKAFDSERANREVRNSLRLFDVATVGRGVLQNALDAGFSDFEDAVLHEAARRAGADALVTRNVDDFRKATLAVYTPTQLRAALSEHGL